MVLRILRPVFNSTKFRVKIFPWKLGAFSFHTSRMAKSKWEYVKTFEAENILLPNCWAVARIDGRGFHKLAKTHNWTRPNDERALKVMNKAAKVVMVQYNDIILSYGQSDEFSFVFRKEAEIFQRRSEKIITTLVSQFASAFVFYWQDYFPDLKLEYPPSFDGRIVLYPSDKNLRDYLSWRQADCHINNLYNTTFWSLVLQGGLTNNDAQKKLSKTLAADKHEILFSEFEINYNNEPEIFRKGTILIQKEKLGPVPRHGKSKGGEGEKENSKTTRSGDKDNYANPEDQLLELTCDLIGDKFWADYPYLLGQTK